MASFAWFRPASPLEVSCGGVRATSTNAHLHGMVYWLGYHLQTEFGGWSTAAAKKTGHFIPVTFKLNIVIR